MSEEERRKSIAWLYYIDITVKASVYLIHLVIGQSSPTKVALTQCAACHFEHAVEALFGGKTHVFV